MTTTQQLLIAGGGIGGLAAALAAARAGWEVRLYERAAEFTEVGAGVQLGPNVTRILQAWGLEEELRAVAAFPDRLQVRNATSGADLGTLALGARALQRYGAPYATIHRADLHRILCMAAGSAPNVHLNLDHWLAGYTDDGKVVTLNTVAGQQIEGDALLGADGVWSRVRQQLLNDGPPRVTGHLAYRTMLRQSALPAALRTAQVTAWLGPRLHVVQYPVRRGEWLNVVAIVHGHVYGDPKHWDHSANAAELRTRLAGATKALRDLVHAIPNWRLWALSDRPPMRSASEHARGRIALLGDAAHPMRPYLAQGAGMAIEDADTLARVLDANPDDVPAALQSYANLRWQRNARVQARAIRNGEIFHLRGPMQVGRDLSLRLLGEKLLDVPWLYRGA